MTEKHNDLGLLPRGDWKLRYDKPLDFVVTATIPITPIAWHLTFRGGQTRPFLGSSAVQYKDTIRHYVRVALANMGIRTTSRSPFTVVDPHDEVILLIGIYFNYNEKFRYQNEMGQWRKKVPDCTNIQKLVEDALEGIIYTNDIQTRTIFTHREQSTTNKLELTVYKYGKEGTANGKLD